MKLPILRILMHLIVWSLIIYVLLNTTGCNRNTEFIILKQPHTEAYSTALEEAIGGDNDK